MKCMTASCYGQSNISNAVNMCSYKHALCEVIKNSKGNRINNNSRLSVRHCELIFLKWNKLVHTDSSILDQLQLRFPAENVLRSRDSSILPIQMCDLSQQPNPNFNDNFAHWQMTPRNTCQFFLKKNSIKMELSFNLLMVNEAQLLCHDWLK